MRASSLEIRQLVVDAYERGVGTHKELSVLFGVGVASSRRWVRQWRDTGDLGVTYVRSGPIALVPAEDLDELRAFVLDGRADWTNEQLKDTWVAHKKISMSRSAMVRALRKTGLSLKKRLSSPVSKTGLTSSRSVSSSEERSSTSKPAASSSSTRRE